VVSNLFIGHNLPGELIQKELGQSSVKLVIYITYSHNQNKNERERP